jgi:hypothetical protein
MENLSTFQDIYKKFGSFNNSTAPKEELDELEQYILKNYVFQNIDSNPDTYGISIGPRNLYDVFKKYGPRKVCQYQFKR